MTDLRCKHKVPDGHGASGVAMLRWCGLPAEDYPIGPRCPQHRPAEGHPHGQRIRAVIAADALTLTRTERHELAELLVGHEGSWKTLSEADARRVADALDAFKFVQALLLLRRNPPFKKRKAS